MELVSSQNADGPSEMREDRFYLYGGKLVLAKLYR